MTEFFGIGWGYSEHFMECGDAEDKISGASEILSNFVA